MTFVKILRISIPTEELSDSEEGLCSMLLVHKRMRYLEIVCLSENSINGFGFRPTLEAHNDTVTSVTTLQNANGILSTAKASNVRRANRLCAERKRDSRRTNLFTATERRNRQGQ